MEKLLYDWAAGTKDLMRSVSSTPSFIRSSFLLKGRSAEMLRSVAGDLAKTLENNSSLPFCGVMKSFGLRLPPFSTHEGATRALEAMMSSVECAAGYYCVFKGLVILELEKAWCEVRDLAALGEYMRYIQANRERICFIFLIPDTNAKRLEDFILQYSVFHVVEVPDPTPLQVSAMFKLIASEKGYTLSSSAEESLPRQAELLLSAGGNYPMVVEHMVEKAAYFHVADGFQDRTLQARDIDRLFVPGTVGGNKARVQIGFARGD